MIEGLCGLNQLTLLGPDIALKQQADAVIIPALPLGYVGSLRGDRGQLRRVRVGALDRERNLVSGDRHNW